MWYVTSHSLFSFHLLLALNITINSFTSISNFINQGIGTSPVIQILPAEYIKDDSPSLLHFGWRSEIFMICGVPS